jgi:hypothetical protein
MDGGRAAPSSPTACDDKQTASHVLQELQTLYQSQQPDGSLEFRGPQRFFERYPLFATLTLDIQRSEPNTAFLSRSSSAAARYYGYLFTEHDRNANLLIETSLPYDDGTTLTGIEDPGFNALLSLDMINLAMLNLRLRKPIDALYWYEGGRTLQERIVQHCYDVDANYFFPFDINNGVLLREYYALSLLPLLFSGNVGDNHAGSLIQHYVLRSRDVGPEPPFRFAEGDSPPAGYDDAPLFHPDYLLKVAMVATTLRARGFPREADLAATAAVATIDWSAQGPAAGKQPSAYARRLACLLDDGQYDRLFDPFGTLDIFEAIVRSKRRLADNEIVRLGTSIQTIRSFAAARPLDNPEATATPDAEEVESSVRDVYWSVSKTRQQLDANTLFDREDAYRTSGLEIQPAMTRLLDDVVIVLRRVENDLHRVVNRDSGLKISATVLNERAVADQQVEIKWVIELRGSQPMEIRAADVICEQELDTLVKAGGAIMVRPGEPQTLVSSFPARPTKLNTLLPWHLTLSLNDAAGRRIRYNALRTVYLERPIAIIARFPEGQILKGLSLPIELQFVKKVKTQALLQGGWYSSSGLQLKEGKQFEFTMPATQDTALVKFHVLVPSPCRPGSFPFKMKFYGDGKDLGTIASSFFKPYQWLFIGPFEAADRAMDVPYPPEKAVDLRKAYAGIGRRIAWQVLPEHANENFGEVHMGGSLTSAGVGYLYTVIDASIEKQCPVYLAANVPATLFVNDVRVLDYKPGTDRVAASTPISVRRGMNNILIKLVGDQKARVFFKLGDDDKLASDEFNNNLWELVGDFGEFQERSRRLQAGETEDVHKLVTLRYEDSKANSVSVIGTFNGWSPENSRMRRSGSGTWEITLSLRPGKYAYRFLVNNRQQVLDPRCPYEEPDGYGGKNSVIYVMK